MFKINPQQMTLFSASTARRFEESMVRHLAGRLPLRSASLGADAVRELVQREVVRAAMHGITVEKDVRRFLELSCALGDAVDAALEHPADPPRTSTETLHQLAALPPADSGADEAQLAETAAVRDDPEGGTSEPAGANPVGQPVMPCPGKTLRKRILGFSA